MSFSIFSEADVLYQQLDEFYNELSSDSDNFLELYGKYKFFRKEISNILSDRLNNPANYPSDLKKQLESRLHKMNKVVEEKMV